MKKSLLKLVVCLAISIVIIGGVGLAMRGLSRLSPAKVVAAKTSSDYVGIETCRSCHRPQAEAHARSGHAKTFFEAAHAPIAQRMNGRKVKDQERNYEHRFEIGADGLVSMIPEKTGKQRFPLQFVFGSGRHAVSFLTLIEGKNGGTDGLEHRITAFGSNERLDITPGTRGFDVTRDVENYGVVLPEGEILDRCIECHTTRFKISGTELTDLLPNVTCESCHGPGAKHVAAVRSGASDMQIKSRWNAQEQLEMCGTCHRRTDWLNEPPDKYDIRIVRFQPVGLSQSKCFTKSNGAMSCLTCHDPHDAPSEDRPSYDARCISCHSPSDSTQHACPVSPREKCVECHMPRIEVHKDFIFSDHWIRVRDAKDLAPLKPFPAMPLKNQPGK